MLIDWFTVGAQALNFLVLVWLMKRFLYKPILHAIDAREQRIAAELSDADAMKAEAKRAQVEFQHKNQELDRERSTLMSQATQDATAAGERAIAAARAAADALTVMRNKALQSEARALQAALARRTQDVVFEIARKAFSDLAATSLEERLGEIFTRRLRELGSEPKALLAQALKATTEPALVRSAFALPSREQALLQNALNETFSAEVQVRFEVAPNVISGIELSCGGQHVGWSLANYLTSLESSVSELLNAAEAKVAAQPATKAEAIAAPQADALTLQGANVAPSAAADENDTTDATPHVAGVGASAGQTTAAQATPATRST